MRIKPRTWLLIIFLTALTLRLTLTFTVSNFTYDSYFHLRQVEEITSTGTPLYHDSLSYGGREIIFPPLFHYFMSFFDLFLPLELAAKLIPNVLMASLTLIIFLISKKWTKDDQAALFSAFVVGFLPALYFTNDFTPITLLLPSIFLAIYAFLNIERKIFLWLYMIIFLIASLTSSATALLLIGFVIYLLLTKIEGAKIKKAEVELILFSLFFFIWTQFLFFKNVFLEEGISFIRQNIPSQIIMEYFPKISIAEAAILVSIIPFVAGVYVAYRSLFQLNDKNSFFLISLVISTTLLAWFRLIQFNLSLIFFGIILCILFASFYKDMTNYIKKTKTVRLQKMIPYILVILLLITMLPSVMAASFNQETPLDEEIRAFQWLKENTPSESTVLSLLEEGYILTYYGQRKNIMDKQFGLIEDAETRFKDLDHLFRTQVQTSALDLLDKYNIKYIILTSHGKERYKISTFKYLDSKCFERAYKEETKIYKVKCALEIKG